MSTIKHCCETNANFKAPPKEYRKVATIKHPSYGYEIERTICEYDGDYIVDVWGLVYRWEWIASIAVYWR